MDFDDDTREPGQVGKLVAAKREKDKLTQEQIGKRAGMARSTVLAIENGHSHPSLAKCLDLARALGIPPRDILDARALDELRDNPDRQRELAAELAGGAGWVEDTRWYLRIQDGRVRLRIAEDGFASILRHYKGCTSPRPLKKLVLRDRIPGTNPSHIEVQRTPIGFDCSSRTNDTWREHHIDFHEPWNQDAIDIRLTVNLERAYLRDDDDEYRRRLKALGLPPEPQRGVYHFYIPYAFERLTFDIGFPESYLVDWDEPCATPDRAMLEDLNIVPLTMLASSAQWKPSSHRGRLTLTRPRAGNSVFFVWRPRSARNLKENQSS